MNTCLLVAGMHRSGTSALCGALHKLGVRFGCKLMPGVEGDNPKGFFEHLDIYSAHEKLLDGLGRTWDDIRPLPRNWLRSKVARRCREELLDVIHRGFSEAGLWAIKDPRICRLIPLWLEVLAELSVSPYFLLAYRNPLEVAASLYRRDGFSAEKSGILWAAHCLEAEKHTRAYPRQFVSFNRLIESPLALLQELSRSAGVEWPRPILEAAGELQEWLDPTLRHQAFDMDFRFEFGRADPLVMTLWERLLHDKMEDGDANAAFEEIYQKYLDVVASIDPLLLDQVGYARSQVALLARDVQRQSRRIEVLTDRVNAWDDRTTAIERTMRIDRQEVDTSIRRIEAQSERLAPVKRSPSEVTQMEHNDREELDNVWKALDYLNARIDHLQRRVSKRWYHKPRRAIERIGRKLGATGRHLERRIRRLRKRLLGQTKRKGGPGLSPSAEAARPGVKMADPKGHVTDLAHANLSAFLSSGSAMRFPKFEHPRVSIILVLYNRCELTLLCLQSILANCRTPYEVILIDNGSEDRTAQLLDRIENATIARNTENMGFVKGVNQGANLCSGDYLLLLNNDAILIGDTVAAAVRLLEEEWDIGVVGGRIILLDGTLQEAGSIIWSDGSTLGCGRGLPADAPANMFRRDVDYCSGAFFTTRRADFEAIGGFDEDYSPAYYEEVDFCVRLAKQGKRTVYEPRAVILHYEFASSMEREHAIALYQRNRLLFVEKHGDWLARQYAPSSEHVLEARCHRDKRPKVLYIDDRVPHPHLGSGFPRAHRIILEAHRLGYFTSVYPLWQAAESWDEVYADLPSEIEVIMEHGPEKLVGFLRERAGFYDIVFISRPHNMKLVDRLLDDDSRLLNNAKLVYDAEAIFAVREIERMKLYGEVPSEGRTRKMIREELALAGRSDVIVAVSEREAQVFRDHGYANVVTLGHALEVNPGGNAFEDRFGLLFVGAVYDLHSPNADSIRWLESEVLPRLYQIAGEHIPTKLVGPMIESMRTSCDRNLVEIAGCVADLEPVYNQARVFVAPTRFAAGIPLKVLEAAAHGVPVVATSILANQLGWKNGEELLVAETSEEFASACFRLHNDKQLWGEVRDNALAAVRRDCSVQTFANTVASVFQTKLHSFRANPKAA